MALADPQRPAAPTADARALAIPFALTTLIWGSTWLVIRTQLGTVPPSWSVTYRFLIGATVLIGLALVQRRSFRLGVRGHVFALLVGVLQFVLNFNLVYRAEQHVASGLVALMFSLLVIANAGLAALFLGQRVTRRFLTGAVMGIAGVALLVAHEVGTAPQTGIGLALAAAAVATASCANVLQASPLARGLPAEAALAVAMLYGAGINAVWALATAGPPVVTADPVYWLGLVYLGVVASALAFMLYYGMIRRVGAAAAGYVNVLVPVVALSLSTVFEGFVWTPLAAAGVVLAIAGLAVALGGRRAVPPPARG